MTAATLLRLANLSVPRKPDRGPAIHPDPLADPVTAAHALGLPSVQTSQLGALRELHDTIVQLTDGLLNGRPIADTAQRLAGLARPSTATVRLAVGEDQSVRAQLVWNEPMPAATLARRAALELAEIDVARLKRCERPVCNLLFYDTTRSHTQRWHADAPCGNRERQRRHRTASRAGL